MDGGTEKASKARGLVKQQGYTLLVAQKIRQNHLGFNCQNSLSNLNKLLFVANLALNEKQEAFLVGLR